MLLKRVYVKFTTMLLRIVIKLMVSDAYTSAVLFVLMISLRQFDFLLKLMMMMIHKRLLQTAIYCQFRNSTMPIALLYIQNNENLMLMIT